MSTSLRLEHYPSAQEFNAEQTQRQHEALRAVNLISRAAGRELQVHLGAEAISPEPGVYIFDPSVQSPESLADVNFTMEERMLSGAANSAHAVIAGELEVDYKDKATNAIEVAAKCYRKRTPEERFERMEREVNITRDMARRGELALEPVAVAIAPAHIAEGSAVFLTRFDRDLFTLDNHPWGRGLTSENIETAVLAAGAIGRFNSFGYEHKDASIKNVAGRPNGQLGMIDFETTIPMDVNDGFAVATAAQGDLGKLLDTLSDKGFFESVNGALSYDRAVELRAAMAEICDAYLANWENASDETQLAVVDAVGEVGQGMLERHSIIPISV